MSTVGGPRLSTIPSFINTYSLDFDGIDDYVDVGEIPPLFKNFPIGTAKDNPWSASMWVKGSTSGAFLQLPYVETNIVGARAFAFAFNGTYLYFGGKFANIKIRESEPLAGGVTAFSTTDWNHILMTFDGVDYTALSSYKLYVNGALIPIELIPVNITDFRIKSILIGGTQLPWLGKIDEVSLFDAELTTSSVTSIYNGGKPTDLTPLNPIAWYRNGDNGSYKSPQWLLPNNENKDKVSNYSFDFDGVDDYLNLGRITAIEGATNFSFSMWVYPTSYTGLKILFGKFASATDFFYAYTNNVFGYVFWHIADGQTNYPRVSTTSRIDLNTWGLLTFVYDGSLVGNLNKAKIYINGTLAITTTNAFQIPSSISLDTTDFYLAQRNGALSTPMAGKIDEVSAYDYSLSASEVMDIYNGGTPTTLPIGAVAHYKMGEEATFSGGVWTVPDNVGSNTGTSANMTIEDRIGEAPSSENNAVSFNMDEVDRATDVPT